MQNRQTDVLHHAKVGEKMNFNKICEEIYKYFADKLEIKGLCAALETEEYFIFSGGDPNVVNYGGCLVAFDKKDCTIEIFEPTNVVVLMSAKKIDIPKEYRYKAS